ncbi:unnamed protein product [Urochloa humidicola]
MGMNSTSCRNTVLSGIVWKSNYSQQSKISQSVTVHADPSILNSLHGTHRAALALLLKLKGWEFRNYGGGSSFHAAAIGTRCLERVKEWPTCQRPTWHGISTGYRIRIQDPGTIRVEHVKLVACPHARYSLS